VPLDRFVYERPVLIDVPKGDAELVRRDELEPHDGAIAEADVLLLRTGWSGIRKSDPVRYAHEGPGVAPDACSYLMDGFPGLKALALDCISLASYQSIDPEGIVAHQILCGVGRGDRYVLIIEDLDLAAYPAGPPPARLYAIPLFPQESDSSPCTVFAELGG
jgi:kynurenine formamidase